MHYSCDFIKSRILMSEDGPHNWNV